jgi:hypothetical protein
LTGGRLEPGAEGVGGTFQRVVGSCEAGTAAFSSNAFGLLA